MRCRRCASPDSPPRRRRAPWCQPPRGPTGSPPGLGDPTALQTDPKVSCGPEGPPAHAAQETTCRSVLDPPKAVAHRAPAEACAHGRAHRSACARAFPRDAEESPQRRRATGQVGSAGSGPAFPPLRVGVTAAQGSRDDPPGSHLAGAAPLGSGTARRNLDEPCRLKPAARRIPSGELPSWWRSPPPRRPVRYDPTRVADRSPEARRRVLSQRGDH